jgi:hypothetical protein
VGAAQAFLSEVNSPLRNLLLTEPPESWTRKLDFASVPCYYVFDRQGKWVRFGGGKEISYDDLDALVVRLLQEK